MHTKPSFCTNCPITHQTDGYVPLHLGKGGKDLFVGSFPSAEDVKAGQSFSDGIGSWLNSMLTAAKISRNAINITTALGCHPHHDELLAKEGFQYCAAHHLAPILKRNNWSRVVALGEEALQSLTARRGINWWRGSSLPLTDGSESVVVATLHPDEVRKKANLFSVVAGDLRKRPLVPPEYYNLWPTLAEVQAFTSPEFAFDLEWDMFGQITMCGLTDKYYHAIVVPWTEPYINELYRIFTSAEVLIGHNIIGADTKYFEAMDWPLRATMIDTMLIQHLVQPDMPHSLAFVASVFTNKVFWKGKGEEYEDADGTYSGTGAQWKTWADTSALPIHLGGYGGCTSGDEAYRLYNARDTDSSYQCAQPLKQLLQRFGMEHVYRNVSVPAAYICRDLADAGLKIDRSKLSVIRDTYTTQIAELEPRLPEGLAPYEQAVMRQIPAPEGTYRPKTKVCRGPRKDHHDDVVFNFTSPNDSGVCVCCGRTVLPGALTLAKTIKVPGTERIVPWNSSTQVMAYATQRGLKAILHGKSGNATADKNARKVWGRTHSEFTIVDNLKHLSTLRNSFAKPGLLETERVYFNLLVHGTAEGRLSSSGRRRGVDPNIQNQPKEIRYIFIPDHNDWGILSADLKQGENMLTAWLAKDWPRWERLNTPGYDEHGDYATNFFGKPCFKGTEGEPLRKVGKIINHMLNYGASWKKLMEVLALQGFFYSTADCKEAIAIWQKHNAGTSKWQKQTIEIAQTQSYLANAFGRKRWFQGRDFATKALAFLPASTLADTVLRMMIALYPARFAKELTELRVGRVGQYPDGWRLSIQVHDELASQGPHGLRYEAAQVVTDVMTQPWPELDGFHFGVDVSYSQSSWGECKPLQ